MKEECPVRVLFVDIDFHLKTRSADFFLDILRTAFEVETHYYHELYHANIPQEKIDRADLIVVWQSTLGRKNFVVSGKPCVYVPMYDCDWGSLSQWQRIGRSGTGVISFSEAINQYAERGRVPKKRLLNIRYAYNPSAFNGFEGDPNVAILWDRGFWGMKEFKKLFAPHYFKKLIVIRRPQPGFSYETICDRDRSDYNIDLRESEFLPNNEYYKLLKEPGVFIAPRPKEGIGMSFLEALAMGKCVIVHNDATMNEYVRDGVNGIVRDFYAEMRPITSAEIAHARSGVKKMANEQYNRWLCDRAQIVPFLKMVAKGTPVRIGGMMDFFLRGMYVKEVLCARMR